MSETLRGEDHPPRDEVSDSAFVRLRRAASERIPLVIFGLIALVLLLATTIWEGDGRAKRRLEMEQAIADSLAHNKPVVPVQDDSGVWWHNPEIITSLLREISFAVLIAVFVSFLIEQASRRRTELEMRNYSRLIARDTFWATLNLFAAKPVWAEIRRVLGDMIVIRSDYSSTYELLELRDVQEITPEARAALGDGYIAMRWRSIYSLTNHSHSEALYDVSVSYPVRTELPNYKELSFVRYLEIDGVRKARAEIQAVVDALPMNGHEARFVWPRKIPGETTINVDAEIIILKEREDNEVWATLAPTQRFKLTGIDSTDGGLKMGVQSFFPGEMREEAHSHGGNVRAWSASRPLLPFQSVTMWWRARDGVKK